MTRLITLLAVVAAATATQILAQAPVPPNPWFPPIGIPTPSFGITQTAGTPTHYVDNSNSSATDTSNPNGTASRPRRTMPTTLEAGSVVEVRGGPYSQSDQTWTFNGTASSPVFIKGVNRPGLPRFATEMYLRGSYFIIEGLVFDNIRFAVATASLHHLSFRYNESS